MTVDVDAAVRDNLATVLASGIEPGELDPDLDLAGDYGLTSLNKVLFMMSVCGDTGVDLGAFTEADVAALRTMGDVVAALDAHAPAAG